MALNSAGIATAVAALTISGVTVKDLSGIPDTVVANACPILMPDIDNWISGGIGGPNGEGPVTFGPGMWEFQRAFGWIYLHSATGQDAGMGPYLSAISAKVDAIETAFTTLDIAGVDLQMIEASGFGEYTDQGGNSFYGCRILALFTERINA